MNALIRKEIRMLFPSWIIALGLALSFMLLPHDVGFEILLPSFLCPAVATILALNTFGGELGAGTFSNLLTQPVERAKVWRTKTLLLAACIGSLVIVWLLSYLARPPYTMRGRPFGDIALGVMVVGLCIYSGGLWTMLLFRQMVAAFWFTILIPAALAMSVGYIFEKREDLVEPVSNAVLIIYSIAGFLFGRRLFLRAQDVQWTGGTVELPGTTARNLFKKNVSTLRIWRPRAALLIKELQLYQSQFIMAGVLAVVHLALVFVRQLIAASIKHTLTEAVLQGFFLVWLLLMPLLFASGAVAEERKLGTFTSQLCLPIHRRTQYRIKWLIALVLSVLFGAIIPILIEGERILPNMKFDPSLSNPYIHWLYATGSFGQNIVTLSLPVLSLISVCLPFLFYVAIALLIGAFSFYASTLSHSTLQGLSLGAATNVGAIMALGMASSGEEILGIPIWRGWLIYIIGVPVLLVALPKLAYWNYQRPVVSGRVWWRNALVLLICIGGAGTATSAIYHRAWEWFTPTEISRGSFRLKHAQLTYHRGGIVTVLSEGQIWLDQIAVADPENRRLLKDDLKIQSLGQHGKFLEGSNWVAIAASFVDVVGIKSDGSLWVSEQPRRFKPRRSLPEPNDDWPKMVRFGNDTNWKNVAVDWRSFFLIKTDGTLWHWGVDQIDHKKHKEWPSLREFTPNRLGTNSDWEEIPNSNEVSVRTKDGKIWGLHGSFLPGEFMHLKEEGTFGISLGLVPNAENFLHNHLIWASLPHGVPGVKLGVYKDGTLRIGAVWKQSTIVGRFDRWGLVATNVLLSAETNWASVATSPEGQPVALKTDGTLWKWKFSSDPLLGPDKGTSTRIGTSSDWIAISQTTGGVISLAADGTPWFWRFEMPYYVYDSGSNYRPLLGPSHKPQQFATIFDENAAH